MDAVHERWLHTSRSADKVFARGKKAASEFEIQHHFSA
jgi:hypothetical protein